MPEKSHEIVAVGFVVGIIILLVAASFIVVLVVYSNKRMKRFLLDQQNMQILFSQTLLQSQIEIQEQTLQHISRELHDNLGQVASLIKINLTTIKINEPEKAAGKIEDTKELTRQLIADIKSLSVSLGSDRIYQLGLANALQTEVDRLNKTGEFIAEFKQVGNMPEIDNDKALILYRMSQEVLNNMVKHSQAKHIGILFQVVENRFILVFNDDGVGFNVEEKANAAGAGLRNLQSRALLINAQIHISSLPGNGTKTIIELPL